MLGARRPAEPVSASPSRERPSRQPQPLLRLGLALVFLGGAAATPARANPQPDPAIDHRTAFLETRSTDAHHNSVRTLKATSATGANRSTVSVSIGALEPPHETVHRLAFTAPPGQSLAVGSYSRLAGASMAFDGLRPDCDATFTVEAVDWLTDAEIGRFSATFALRCPHFGTDSWLERFGSIRFLDPARATIAYAVAGWPLTDTQAVAFNAKGAYPGILSEPSSVTLVNVGSANLVLGARQLVGMADGYGDVSGVEAVADSCQNRVLAPDASCTLTIRSRLWLHGPRSVHLTYPSNSPQGSIRLSAAIGGQKGRFAPIVPTRLVDTRVAIGIDGALASGVPRTFQVTDRHVGDATRNIPSDAVAVVGNLTVVGQTSAGYLSLTTEPTASPTVSSINVPSGDVRANGVTVRLAPSGALAVTWMGGPGSTAQVIFDAVGSYVPIGDTLPGNFHLTGPRRVLDTRIGLGLSGPFEANVPRTFTVAQPHPSSLQYEAVAGNLTVVAPVAAGYLSVTPTPTATPSTSTLNFPAGDIRANNFVVALGPNRTISVVYKGPANTRAHVVVDVFGIYGPQGSGFVALTPNRILDTRFGLGKPGSLLANEGVFFDCRDRRPGDHPRNVPPPYTPALQSTGIVACVGNLTVTRQTSAGWISAGRYAGVPGTLPTSNLNFPPGDNRANGAIVPENALYLYGARAGARTDVIFDVAGYFAY